MTSIILKEKEEGTFTLKKFYERRIRRIIPMLIFTLLIFLPFAYYHLQEKELIFYTKSALRAIFAISNIFFANNTGGYFDTATDFIPLIHTWTLGVEEQFYVILPLIFIILWKIGKNKIFVLLSYLVIISFFLNFVFKNTTHNFYLLHTRFWELGIGSLIAFIKEVKIKNFSLNFGFNGSSKVVNVSSNFVYNLISLLSLITILLSTHYLHEKINNLQFRMLLPIIATALLILFTTKDTITHKILSFKPFRLLGLISYSAYLLHQPIFALVRTSSLEAITKTEWYLWSVLVFMLAYFTWKFVENPFRNKEKIKYKHILIAFAFFIALFHFANVITKKNKGFPKRFEMSEELKRSFVWNIDENFDKPAVDGKIVHITKIGNPTEKPKFILTGDSMSSAILPIFKEYGMAGEYFARWGCHDIKKNCTDYPEQSFEYIIQNNIKNVVLTQINVKLIENLLKNNINIYLIYDFVASKEARDIYNQMIKTKNFHYVFLSRKEHNDRVAKLNSAISHISDSHLKIINISDLVCNTKDCPIGTKNHSYYADRTHFTPYGLKLIEARIKKEILDDIKNNN
jgi:peptidoglycan/LPS O-acetylase OafA/YrhL